MITIDSLKQWGANAEEGLQRCMGNEALYLRLVNKFIEDDSFKQLKNAISNGELERAFQLSHALKGVLGNLSLTPLYEIIYEMTELLRYQTETDYNPLINKYENSYSLLLH